MTPTENNENVQPFGSEDELWGDAVEFAKQQSPQDISVSKLQRKFSIAFTRAHWLYEGLVAVGLAQSESPNELKEPQVSKEPDEPQEPMISPWKVWCLGIALAALADWLFWKQPLGWCLGLYGFLLGGAIVSSLPGRSAKSIRRMRGPIILLVVSILAFVYHASTLAIIVAIISLVGMVVASRMELVRSALQWTRAFAVFIRKAWLQALSDILRFMFNWRSRNVGNHLKIGCIAAGLSLIFVALFISANPILEKFYNNTVTFLSNLDIKLPEDFAGRVLYFLLMGFWVWMLLRFRSAKQAKAKSNDISLPTLPISITDACLIAFNLVFLLQTVMDLCYLFGGASLPDGMSYAQYAHRGFYPLWTTSMLAGAFMLLAWPDDPKKELVKNLTYRLAQLWMAQNVLLLFSALYRLYLYVCAYSLTMLRFFAEIGMVLVFIGLGSVILRMLRKKHINWLVNINAFAVIAMLAILSLTNIPGIVARFNVNHCREASGIGPKLDVDYLKTLGTSALPALIQHSQQNLTDPNMSDTHHAIASLQLEFEQDVNNWRAWTIENTQITEYLNAYTPPNDTYRAAALSGGEARRGR